MRWIHASLLALVVALPLARDGSARQLGTPSLTGRPVTPFTDTSCRADPDPAASLPAIVAPTSGIAVSRTLPLAVTAPPTTAIDKVLVCVDYLALVSGRLTQRNAVPLATLTASNGWASAWDVSPASGLPSQGNVTLTFVAHDATTGASILIGTVAPIVIDHAPPVSTATLEGAHQYVVGDGTVYVAEDTPFALSATDPALDDGSPGSGAALRYRIDDGPESAYAALFTLGRSGDGDHRVTYSAIDPAGNAEAEHNMTVRLDQTGPAVTPLITGAFGADGMATGPVTVSLTATDSGSGVAGITYALSPGCTLAPCTQPYTPGQQIVISATTLLTYGATDRVGHATTGTLAIDVATPTTTPMPTRTPTATHTPTPTRAPTETHTPAPTRVPTDTPVPTPTHTPTTTRIPTGTAIPAPTRTPTATDTPAPASMPTATHTPRPTHTPTPVDVPTATHTPTATRVPTATRTPTPAHTPAAVRIATATRTPSLTRTPRPTPTWAPLDGPPLLHRQPLPAATVPAGRVHTHTLPHPSRRRGKPPRAAGRHVRAATPASSSLSRD